MPNPMPGVPDVIEVRRYLHDLLSSCVPLFAGFERCLLQDLQLPMWSKKVCDPLARNLFHFLQLCLVSACNMLAVKHRKAILACLSAAHHPTVSPCRLSRCCASRNIFALARKTVKAVGRIRSPEAVKICEATLSAKSIPFSIMD